MLVRVLPKGLCLSVWVCNMLVLYQNGCTCIELIFGTQAALNLCFKEIRVSPKIRVRPSGTLSQTIDFENSAISMLSVISNWQSSVLKLKWQHLATVDWTWWPSGINSWPTTVTCWQHLASSFVYSAMGDWVWCNLSHGPSASAETCQNTFTVNSAS